MQTALSYIVDWKHLVLLHGLRRRRRRRNFSAFCQEAWNLPGGRRFEIAQRLKADHFLALQHGIVSTAQPTSYRPMIPPGSQKFFELELNDFPQHARWKVSPSPPRSRICFPRPRMCPPSQFQPPLSHTLHNAHLLIGLYRPVASRKIPL